MILCAAVITGFGSLVISSGIVLHNTQTNKQTDFFKHSAKYILFYYLVLYKYFIFFHDKAQYYDSITYHFIIDN